MYSIGRSKKIIKVVKAIISGTCEEEWWEA
jgi:hypothetical protein